MDTHKSNRSYYSLKGIFLPYQQKIPGKASLVVVDDETFKILNSKLSKDNTATNAVKDLSMNCSMLPQGNLTPGDVLELISSLSFINEIKASRIDLYHPLTVEEFRNKNSIYSASSLKQSFECWEDDQQIFFQERRYTWKWKKSIQTLFDFFNGEMIKYLNEHSIIMRRGDVLQMRKDVYRNSDKLLFDGEKFVPLYYDIDDYGSTIPSMAYPEFPLFYWAIEFEDEKFKRDPTIRTLLEPITHNRISFLSSDYREKLANNVKKVEYTIKSSIILEKKNWNINIHSKSGLTLEEIRSKIRAEKFLSVDQQSHSELILYV